MFISDDGKLTDWRGIPILPFHRPKQTPIGQSDIPMYMDPIDPPDATNIPIHGATGFETIPVSFFEPHEEKIKELYGRTLVQLKLRGLSVREAADLLLVDRFGQPGKFEIVGPTLLCKRLRAIVLVGAPDMDGWKLAKPPVWLLDATSTMSTTIPLEILEQQREQQKRFDEALAGPMSATSELRWAVPEGTHLPDETKLQQLWTGVTNGGYKKQEWRDVPRVVVKG